MDFNEKQIEILEVVERLFSENGFDGTSLRQIAKEAGINIAMVSYYFGSKDKMLDALIQYRMADFRLQLDAVMHEDSSFDEKLEKIVELLVSRVHSKKRIYKILHFEFSNRSRADFEKLKAQKLDNYALFEQFIKDGQDAGAFRTGINAALIIPTILGTYFHYNYNKEFFVEKYGINEDMNEDQFVHTTLTQHLTQTIKALLSNEK